jgi:hypothetical protein
VDLRMQFGEPADGAEHRPRPSLGVREQGDPVDPLEDDPAAALDLDQLVRGGHR